MTEEQWLACQDPDVLLKHLSSLGLNRTKGGRRKLRLFGCNCARRVARLMTDDGRAWLQLGEQYAGGLLGKDKARSVTEEPFRPDEEKRVDHAADSAAWLTLLTHVMVSAQAAAISASIAVAREAINAGRDDLAAESSERQEQAYLLRDLFGNPFRPLTVPTSLLTDEVLALARQAYDHRTPDGVLDRVRVLALADALVGSTAASAAAWLLEHLRDQDRHWRGCVAIDAILGKH